ncbi:MAG TPA: alkaline phosphatase D family protein [Candidatus Obscuribacterales bacterium]
MKNAKHLHQNFLTSLCLVIGTSGGLVTILPSAARAAILYNAVAAGDPTDTSAILWTRTADATTNQGVSSNLTAQISTDESFSSILHTFSGTTNPNRDYTLKLDATGLQSGTRYYYRFQGADGELSQVGTFKTAPSATQQAPVRFAFSGDTAGEWRPYGLTKDFNNLNLDFFVYLGDAIYETGSGNTTTGVGISPPTADPLTNPTQALADYRRKYLENLQPVTQGGSPGLQTFYASQGNYTLLDNHELGSRQFDQGGAPAGTPPGAGADATNPIYDVNTTGTFINETPGYQALMQAFNDYQPVRETTISAPGDARTDGTQQLYFAQQWGANLSFINVDDRSYRDIRMKTTLPNGQAVDDTGDRANNPDRTMLGETQLEWLKNTLLQAENNDVAWKVIAISTPIDEAGSSSGNGIIPLDTGKTWIGGYRAERNEILQFIDENDIDNVIFLTTDDHETRINELTYFSDLTDPNSRVVVPNAFTIVGGPLGAFGPGLISDHSFSNIQSIANNIVAQQQSRGVNPLGLDPQFPGLQNVFREGNPNADSLREAVDFYSPDTFNYVTLDVSADGRTLSVNTYGIDPYAPNTFPSFDQIASPRRIFGFDIVAASVPEPSATIALLALSAYGIGTRLKRKSV